MPEPDSFRCPNSTIAPVSHDPLAGTPYCSVMPLGQGGMGEVVEARHVALDRPVVVKLLHNHFTEQRELIDRMRLEAQALAGLQHPNIVAVFDFGATPDGRPYLVMERLHGSTLKEELRQRGKLPWREAIDLVGQALAGLAAAHRAGIVHRDVKLDNLFVCDGGYGRRTLKLLDFGIAKVIPGAANAPLPLACPTEEGITVGSPLFFSPEQALGKPVDCRTDIYAMGIVLYMLLTGNGPFPHAKSFGELVRAHVGHVPAPLAFVAPPRVASEIDRVVHKALAKNPADRFGTAAEFAAELIRIGTLQAPLERMETEPLAFDASALRTALPWDRASAAEWSSGCKPLGTSLTTVPIAAQQHGSSAVTHPPWRRESRMQPTAFSTAHGPAQGSKPKTLPFAGVNRWELYVLVAATAIALAALAAILYGLGA